MIFVAAINHLAYSSLWTTLSWG